MEDTLITDLTLDSHATPTNALKRVANVMMNAAVGNLNQLAKRDADLLNAEEKNATNVMNVMNITNNPSPMSELVRKNTDPMKELWSDATEDAIIR